ncbi:phosphodiester glycosidase family protein [Candidatus Dojkabacteria bacterium]|nr:phosphodiester glycosidase family protein [Candidatus Dojkabacteria bacterium]
MLNFIISIWIALISLSKPSPTDWRSLAPGLDIININTKNKSVTGSSHITVIRINPQNWELVFLGRSITGDRFGKTAREWCESHNLTAAINAGMFQVDNYTHVGYFKFRDHVNSSSPNKYKSVLAFDPKSEKLNPPIRIFDLDDTINTISSILKDYNSVAQNLRLIKRAGINVWARQNRKWSEAAIGEDNKGNILFIMSIFPFPMHDFNDELLESGIGIVAAQHLEGGPEAQIYLKVGDYELEQFGSYETGYLEDDSNINPWPIPNILGIRKRE